MIRAVLDEVVPADVAAAFSDEQVVTDTFPADWRSLPDGGVLGKAIEAGYDWLITCDKQMPFQQSLRHRHISVLVLPVVRAPELERIARPVRTVLRRPVPQHFIILNANGSPVGKPAAHFPGSPKQTR